MEGPQSRVEEQVTNGFCVRLALLYLLVKGEPSKETGQRQLSEVRK